METLIIILSLITIMIICYNINKYIVKKYIKRGEDYDWNLVNINLLLSFTIFGSVIYWMIFLIYKLPAIPETPPKWL